MPARRKRFTPDQRSTLTNGTAVEWRNGRHWHPGTVEGAVYSDDRGQQYLPVRSGKATRTRTGPVWDLVPCEPTAVRLPE